ncbi:MAG: RagB/SusD family nutrient uptake outer membrane protein, partial [Bacteroidota bacterium]
MKNRIILWLIPCMVLLNTSCEDDFLENTPTDAISANDALATNANMALIIEGLHRAMYQNLPPGSTNSRNGQSYFVPADDAITGNVIRTGPGFGWMQPELQWLAHTEVTGLTVFNAWYQRYHIIASASEIINETEGVPVDPELATILGQAHAYRAWAYLQLITHFARGYLIGNPATDPGVPLLTGTEPPYESGPRAPVQAIYDQMNADIDQAIVLLAQANSRPNKSHLNLNVAHGIRARIALNSGDWAAAAESARLARDGFPLMTEAEWKSGFNDAGLPEAIWASTIIETESNGFASYFYYICNNFNGGETRGNPKAFNNLIWDQVPDTDWRKDVVLPLAPNTNPSATNDEGGSAATDPNYDDQERFE